MSDFNRLKQILRNRPSIGRRKSQRFGYSGRRRRVGKYSWQKQLAKHSDESAKACQKILRKVPGLTAHRITEGDGSESITIKSDRRKAEVKIGIDACDIKNMKHICTIIVDGEEVKREEYPIEMEEAELGEAAADLLLAELHLAEPEEVEEFGEARVFSWAKR